MRSGSDALKTLGILVAAIGGVAVIIFGMVALISPAPPMESAAPSAAPSLTLDTPPTAVGGSVTVAGDRSGTLILERSSSSAHYQPAGDTFELVFDPVRLEGADGVIIFSRDPKEGVTQVDYDGLTAYLDPGDCSITTGTHDLAAGLVTAELECAEVTDIRGGGTISLHGVVGLPAELFGIRGEMPSSGGTLDVDSATVEFGEAIGVIGPSTIAETGRIPFSLVSSDQEWVVAIEYNPETDEYVMTYIGTGDEATAEGGGCPLTAETIGMLSPQTSVVRLEFDCADVPLANGESGPVVGSLVVDLFDTRD